MSYTSNTFEIKFIKSHLSKVGKTTKKCIEFWWRLSPYWNGKKFQAAEIKVPELRINEMIQAGLHHLDLVTYGEEPNGPLCPTLGLYSPIGSECGPVIQFFDSVGLHNRAERALDYFLEKQHENGFMQNFDYYMLETEALLWTFGEHYKYTKDHVWVRRIKSKLLLASQYILSNRAKRKSR